MTQQFPLNSGVRVKTHEMQDDSVHFEGFLL